MKRDLTAFTRAINGRSVAVDRTERNVRKLVEAVGMVEWVFRSAPLNLTVLLPTSYFARYRWLTG